MGEEQEGRTVGILVVLAEPDRLIGGGTVLGRALGSRVCSMLHSRCGGASTRSVVARG